MSVPSKLELVGRFTRFIHLRCAARHNSSADYLLLLLGALKLGANPSVDGDNFPHGRFEPLVVFFVLQVVSEVGNKVRLTLGLERSTQVLSCILRELNCGYTRQLALGIFINAKQLVCCHFFESRSTFKAI